MTPVVRVMVADDSRTVRALLRETFAVAGGIDVVGEAEDGLAAVQLAARLRPDVITMDIAMPELDGLQATARIMAESAARILVVCGLGKDASVDLSLRAIAAGALEVIGKPGPGAPGMEAFGKRVVEAVRLMAEVPVVTRRQSTVSEAVSAQGAVPPAAVAPTPSRRFPEAIGLVASTGGPPALARVFSGLPAGLPSIVLVAQHMSPGFMAGLVSWLRRETPLRVVMAKNGEPATPGNVYLAPDGCDLVVRGRGVLGVVETNAPTCPSGDALLSSLARHYGNRSCGVVLTGMGEDGARGLLAIRETGGLTIAQDAASSVVYGMPCAAAELGAAMHVLPLDAVAGALRAGE